MIEIMKSLYDIWAMFKSLTNDSRSAYLDNLQAFENHIRFILRWYRNKGFKDGKFGISVPIGEVANPNLIDLFLVPAVTTH